MMGDVFAFDLTSYGFGTGPQVIPYYSTVLNPTLSFIDGSTGSSLTLSAAYAPDSIQVSADVASVFFTLLQGEWVQTVTLNPEFAIFSFGETYNAYVPTLTTLLSFMIGDVHVDGLGNIINYDGASSVTRFLRTAGGTGTPSDPYLIVDAYGLQGIGSDSYTLAANYELMGGGITTNWHDVGFVGVGFVPIGNAITPFTGSINGAGLADPSTLFYGPPDPIQNPVVDTNLGPFESEWTGANNIGVFGVNAGTITNISTQFLTFAGDNNIGFVGDNQGTLSSISAYNIYSYGSNNVGDIAGVNSGSITQSLGFSDVAVGTSNVGGIAGSNSGSINQIFYSGYVSPTASSGGIAGTNTGTITDSFWDTDATGMASPSSNQASIPTVTGGCWGGSCTNGGTVDLTAMSTFTNAGWDFNSIWGIDPQDLNNFGLDPTSVSVPYLRSAFPNGIRIFHGTTSPGVADQPLFAFTVTLDPVHGILSESPLHGYYFTNADGSFDITLFSRGFLAINNTGMGLIGGGLPVSDLTSNVVGAVSFPTGLYQGTALGIAGANSKNISNLVLKDSIISGGTPFSGFLDPVIVAQILSGVNYGSLVSLQQYINLLTVHTSVVGTEATQIQSFYNALILASIYGNEIGKSPTEYAYSYSVDSNIQVLMKQLQELDNAWMKRYDVVPDACKR